MLAKIVNCLLRLRMISSAACSFSTIYCNVAADDSLAFSYANASCSFKNLSWLSAAVLNSKASLIRGCIEFSNSIAFVLHDSIYF